MGFHCNFFTCNIKPRREDEIPVICPLKIRIFLFVHVFVWLLTPCVIERNNVFSFVEISPSLFLIVTTKYRSVWTYSQISSLRAEDLLR